MKKTKHILILLLGIHLFFLINLQFTAWPEMLSYPYLKNNGFLLYQDMIHPYPPLLTNMLGVFYNLFGYKLWVMKVFVWVLFLTNDLFVFLIAKRITKSEKSSILVVLFYVFAQPFLEGNMIWFDNVVVTPVLIAIYFLLKDTFKGTTLQGVKNKSLFYAGVFLAIAALIKQTAGLFLILAAIYVYIKNRNFIDIYHLSIAPVFFGLILLLKLALQGTLEHFFNWTLVYPMTMWSSITGYVDMSLANREFVVLLILFLPVILLFWRLKIKALQGKSLILFLFLLGGLISVYPRFSYFHLQTAIAFSAIFFGLLVNKLNVSNKFLVVYFGLIIYLISYPATKTHWNKEPRFLGQEDSKRARIIRKKVNKGETVYLLGVQSGLYAVAGRLPPKPWFDNFPWYLEFEGVQNEIIKKWVQNPPGYVFWAEPQVGNEYDLGSYQPEKITDWIEKNYNKRETAWDEVWIWVQK